jgi:hypothetical protein
MSGSNGGRSRYPMTNRKVRATAVNIVAALMLLFETSAFAKTTPITLPELVKRSSVIVYGHMGKVGGSPLRPSASWVPFKASQIIKGDLSLTREDILLCDSRPPMMEYPDLSRLRGDLVLFLRRKRSGCYEFTHTVKSVVEVHEDQATTVVINDQPHTQSFELFLKKLRYLVAKQRKSLASIHRLPAVQFTLGKRRYGD